jgi:osmoprotectant transport system substrate-binding protein
MRSLTMEVEGISFGRVSDGSAGAAASDDQGGLTRKGLRGRGQRCAIKTYACIWAIAAVTLLGLAGCGSSSSSGSSTSSQAAAKLPGTGKPPIAMGAKSFTEEEILGQLYAQALEAKGYKVTLNDSFPGVALINSALKSGKIQWYPEYTAEVVTAVGGQLGRNITTAEQEYNVANTIERKQGFELLKMTTFSDSNAVAVLPSYAAKYHLQTIGDLKKIGTNASSVTYGDAPENRTIWTGLVGLKQAYGLTNIQFKGLGFGLLPLALKNGSVDAADIFQTDPSFKQYHFVALKDTKNIFGFQNIAPVVSAHLLQAEGPAFADTLNSVSALLTLPAMIKLNAAVVVDRLSPTAVAKQFLKANGLA